MTSNRIHLVGKPIKNWYKTTPEHTYKWYWRIGILGIFFGHKLKYLTCWFDLVMIWMNGTSLELPQLHRYFPVVLTPAVRLALNLADVQSNINTDSLKLREIKWDKKYEEGRKSRKLENTKLGYLFCLDVAENQLQKPVCIDQRRSVDFRHARQKYRQFGPVLAIYGPFWGEIYAKKVRNFSGFCLFLPVFEEKVGSGRFYSNRSLEEEFKMERSWSGGFFHQT